MKAKVGDIEYKKREVSTIKNTKEVVGCVQDVVDKKNFSIRLNMASLKILVLIDSHCYCMNKNLIKGEKTVLPTPPQKVKVNC